MAYGLVVFDLDGTILNTLHDLADAVNYALALHRFPTHSEDHIRTCIGNGVSNLITRTLPYGVDDAVHDRVLSDFRTYYGAHIDDRTGPYPGICELMKSLRGRGIRVGINSNKYDLALQRLCESHFPGLYDFAMGESEATPKKPDPAAALRMAGACHLSAEACVYVGDSAVDWQTARNAGMDFAWVSWGFRTRGEMGNLPLENAFDDVKSLESFLTGF